MSNINNSSRNKNENDLRAKLPITKPIFVPMKNKIQLMESDQAKSKTQSEEFLQKHKSIMAHKLIENFENEPKLSDGPEEEKNGNGHKESNGHDDAIISLKNGKMQCDTPPKPLPRKSISEQGSFEENSIVLPKPRPRTACPNLTYKVSTFYSYLFWLFCIP